MTTQANTFTATVFGDAPDAFGFRPENDEEEMAFTIRADFNQIADAIRKQVNSEFPLKFSIRERSVTGDKAGNEAARIARYAEAGISEGENFYETPMGRVEWEYLNTKMGHANDADSDRSYYKFIVTIK